MSIFTKIKERKKEKLAKKAKEMEVPKKEPITDEDIKLFSELIVDAYEDPNTLQLPEISKSVKKSKRKKKFKKVHRVILTIIALVFSFSFLVPTILTVASSFMAESELDSNYGVIFKKYAGNSDSMYEESTPKSSYTSDKVNLKIIPDKVSLSQYATVLLKSPDYLLKFWNSIIYVVPIVLFQIAIALGASYAFMRVRSKFRAIVFFIYVALMLMPFQVTLVPNYIVAEKLGTLNTIWAILLPGFFAPFSVYLLTKFMRRIPHSLIEAAKLDGAGEWRIFTQVCVPLCKSAITSVAILLFIDYWNMVEQPVIMLNDADKYPLSVFLSQINQGETGIAFAVATIYMIPTILMFLNGEENLVEGISFAGGVKQ